MPTYWRIDDPAAIDGAEVERASGLWYRSGARANRRLVHPPRCRPLAI